MNTSRFRTFCFAVLLGLGATAAMAATIADRVDFAQRRIEQGIRSGTLTREEAHRLQEEFSRVRYDENRARADGHLDYRERMRLDRELDRLERHISYLKHNEEQRGNRGGGQGGRR